MKFKIVSSCVAVFISVAVVPVSADGLLYQLPEDGEWVEFDSEVTMTQGDNTRTATGKLRMSSVGQVREDGKPCRWIEFKLMLNVDDNERVIVAKLLVPETHLKEGQRPVENRVRGWVRMGADREVEELTENNLGPVPAFLANPLSDVKQLEAEIVKSKLGELSCAGLTGRTAFVEGTANNRVTFETRRHQKAPFGVVASRMKIDVERDGKPGQAVEMNMTLSDFGKSARSELANQ